MNEFRKIPLRDFKGLENCDSHTSRMVLDFSLNIAQGNMDQAFRWEERGRFSIYFNAKCQ